MNTEEALGRMKELLSELQYLVMELEGNPPEPPANVTPIRKPDEVEVEGVIGRPELKEIRGKTLFTAGLGIKEGDTTQWLSLNAWGSVATSASTLRRGQVVKVIGKAKDVQYVDSYGVLKSKKQLTASLISPVESAS